MRISLFVIIICDLRMMHRKDRCEVAKLVKAHLDDGVRVGAAM
jgi:hypothetical protein